MAPHAEGSVMQKEEDPNLFVVDYGSDTQSRHFNIKIDGAINRERTADTHFHVSEKPNILYIMADQMAAPLLKLHDPNSPIKTPNIDKLAEEGVVFNKAYCNSPLCAPSRFCMVSGQLPSQIGAYDNAALLGSDVPTYAHYLRREGYETSLAGKMHFIGADQLHGYEHRLTPDIYPGDFGWSVNWDAPRARQEWYHNMSSVWQAGPCARSNQLDFDEEVMYKTTQYLYDYARQDPRKRRPFCMTVAMTHPHDPYTITPEHWDKYEDVDIPLPKVTIPQDEQDPHSVRLLKTVDHWDRPLPEEAIKRARRAYYGSCSYVDTQVGKLMKILKDCKFDEDTIVIFSGDHGDMLGERSLWYKMSWYENSARVPLVVHYPKRFKPHRVNESVSTLDLLPTLLEMTGCELDAGLPIDGTSFYKYLVDANAKGKDEAFGEYMGEGTITPVMMIRRGAWKYTTSLADPAQLYNMDQDPLELRDLATSTDAKVAKVFAAFQAEAKLKWDLPAIHKQVVKSQRMRRFCWSALKRGRFEPWDYEPPQEATRKYIRSTIPLDDLERRARYPPVDAYGRESLLASTHGAAGAKGE